ncbi:FHA domain-containing protein [Marinimicrobium locisalis]|uniref:FHA domain-containing protein n=1 Tax=Marinimicrobium locisalis TaxID=546022 RepID=UPI003221A6D8
MLKLQFKDQRQPAFWVVEKLYSIGSDADNNLVLSDEGIAPLQARLIATAEKIFLKDNNSESGCFVNGQRITQKEILPGDEIQLGPVRLEVLDPGEDTHPGAQSTDPWRLVASGSWLSGQSYVIPNEGSVVLGRSNQCDVVIPGTHLSRRHVELRVQGGSLRVKDLDSVNGTYLNDRPITDALAHGGDQLRLDVYTFNVISPVGDRQRTRLRATSTINSVPAPRAPRPPPTAEKPRRWKLRPTSPGNRQEPTYREQRQERWLWLVVVAAAVLLVVAFYWV